MRIKTIFIPMIINFCMNPFILSHPIVRPLYGFLKECLTSPLEKIILDCGAGGSNPPITLFHYHGFTVYGIDISSDQIELAHKFGRKNNIRFNIMKANVCHIPLKGDSISFIYSINTLCHLSKKDTSYAVKEMERVVKPEGIIFINFISVEDWMFGEGKQINRGEFLQEYDWYPGIIKEGHICSYYEEKEPDSYFTNFEIMRKEKRIISLPIDIHHEDGGGWQMADICYTVKKEK
jgi:ubiquinone/menaquinone biosynthesis C-methylase UbiE